MTYAGAEYWNGYFRALADAGDDLDWGGRWTEPFLTPLRLANVRTVLELGCGTGNDAARLAAEGLSVTAVDLSAEAIERAGARFGGRVRFLVCDIAAPLPFDDGQFDAVMSNVALHMFPDSITRSVFAEIARVLRKDGLFLFHVNALEDRALRVGYRPVERELEEHYVLEESGQTMHLFTETYLRELLAAWCEVRLEWQEIPDRETGEPFKRVWRGIATR
jgi:SAM-dependent methyltransferase